MKAISGSLLVLLTICAGLPLAKRDHLAAKHSRGIAHVKTLLHRAQAVAEDPAVSAVFLQISHLIQSGQTTRAELTALLDAAETALGEPTTLRSTVSSAEAGAASELEAAETASQHANETLADGKVRQASTAADLVAAEDALGNVSARIAAGNSSAALAAELRAHEANVERRRTLAKGAAEDVAVWTQTAASASAVLASARTLHAAYAAAKDDQAASVTQFATWQDEVHAMLSQLRPAIAALPMD